MAEQIYKLSNAYFYIFMLSIKIIFDIITPGFQFCENSIQVPWAHFDVTSYTQNS